MGRPSTYRPDIAAAICQLISISTDSLAVVCGSSARFPSDKAFYRWLLDHKELRELYAQARDAQSQVLADQILPLADSATAENWQAKRLQVEARKWLLSKLQPQKYGDKLEIEHRVEKVILPPNPQLLLAEGVKELQPEWDETPDVTT